MAKAKQINDTVSDLPEGFKMTELGPLPEEWEVVRLGEIIALERGVSWSKSAEATSGIGVLSIPNIREDGRVDLTPRVRILKNIPYEKWITRGDVLLVGSSGSIQNVGRMGVVSDDSAEPLTYASFTVRGRVNDSWMVQNFLPFLLRSPWVKFSMFSKRAADGKYNLQLRQLRDHLVPLPPLSEQKAIAYVLQTVQRAKEATEKVIQATQELKKSLMRHLFTYGPVSVDEVDKVQLKETEIGLVPEHWEVVRLGDIFEIQQGKALSPKHRIGKSPFPFLRTANILWGQIDLSVVDEMDFTDEEVQRFKLLPGDLLICEGGDIGRTAIWRGELSVCCYQNHIHRLRSKNQEIEAEFYMYWMQAAILLFGLYLGQENKTTIPNLSKSRLATFAVPFPSLLKQRAIVRVLQTVDKKLQAEKIRKQALETLFQSLLHNLITGKLRVKNIILRETKEE